VDETAAAVVDVAMLRSLLLRKWSRGISLAQRLASRPPHSRFCGQFPDWVQEAVLRAPPPVAVRLSADRGSKAETRPQDGRLGRVMILGSAVARGPLGPSTSIAVRPVSSTGWFTDVSGGLDICAS